MKCPTASHVEPLWKTPLWLLDLPGPRILLFLTQSWIPNLYSLSQHLGDQKQDRAPRLPPVSCPVGQEVFRIPYPKESTYS